MIIKNRVNYNHARRLEERKGAILVAYSFVATWAFFVGLICGHYIR